jgi:prepilin-type N-terminal cleavage/methylation domain-containing protein
MADERRWGFTLVELLVASSMMAVLAGAGYAALTAGTRSAGKVRRVGEMVMNGQMALAAMARDIREAAERGGTCLTALDASYEGLSADTIDFMVPNRDATAGHVGSPCERGYYIDNDPDTEAQWLVRRTDVELDEDPLEGGSVELAGSHVAEMELCFYDGGTWVDGWSDSGTFPQVVRVGIVVVDAEDIEEPLYLETSVAVLGR